MPRRLTAYFADLHAALGGVVATKTPAGLLRSYFPKGSDFGFITDEVLASVVRK